MDVPGWFSFGAMAFLVFFLFRKGRFLSRLWHKSHEPGRSPDDEWDPFG